MRLGSSLLYRMSWFIPKAICGYREAVRLGSSQDEPCRMASGSCGTQRPCGEDTSARHVLNEADATMAERARRVAPNRSSESSEPRLKGFRESTRLSPWAAPRLRSHGWARNLVAVALAALCSACVPRFWIDGVANSVAIDPPPPRSSFCFHSALPDPILTPKLERAPRDSQFISLLVISAYWFLRPDRTAPRLRFTRDTWIGWAPLFVAKEKKLFGETVVEFVPAHGSGEKRALVYRGDADAIGETIDMLEFSSSAAAVAPGVILWASDRSNGADAIVASADVKNLADLLDKRVGLELGTPGHYMLLHHLAGAGLPLDRLRLRDLTIPDAAEEFAAGRLDATATWYPHLRLAMKRQGSHVVLSSRNMTGNHSVRDIVAVNPSFLAEHPRTVRDFFIGWCAALRYIKNTPTDAKRIMADNLDVSLSELERELEGVEFYGYEENLDLFRSDEQSPIVANILQVREVWQAAGLARHVDSIERRVSAEIINSVTAQDIDERLKSALRGR